VSGPALAIGRTALVDTGWQSDMRRRLADQAAALDAVLAKSGLKAAGGTSLFRLARHAAALALHERLARAHVWTRVFDRHAELMRFGLPADRAGLDRLAELLAHTHR
jgi:cobalamin biosynthetic protein CobC